MEAKSRSGSLTVAGTLLAITAVTSAALLATSCNSTDGTSPAEASVITVHGMDFAFDAPTTVPAGTVTINFLNDGPAMHQAQLVRLDSGRTAVDLRTALAQPGVLPGWVVYVGGPNAVDSGATSNATLALSPGNYALLCVVNAPDGAPHYVKGMIRPLTVSESAPAGASAPAPVADVTVTLDDYKFALSKPLLAGPHTFEIRNPDSQAHEIELIRLAPGKTLADMLAWLKAPSGPPPRQALGGEAIIAAHGAPVYFTATLEPGDYAFICFVADATDGKPHFMHGMTLPFTVK